MITGSVRQANKPNTQIIGMHTYGLIETIYRIDGMTLLNDLMKVAEINKSRKCLLPPLVLTIGHNYFRNPQKKKS
jgi:hypothetical protein